MDLEDGKNSLKAIMRKRQLQQELEAGRAARRKKALEDKMKKSKEFLMYRGKDMFTPKQPFLNAGLYDEALEKMIQK